MKELFRKIFKKIGDELFTIPNMLSILRLLLIPVIVYSYCFLHNYTMTVIIVLFSSLTDVVDGYIARKFNMITDFGKFLDPLADKATQIVVLGCLVTEFSLMLLPCAVLLFKEVFSLILRFVLYKETEIVEGAKWHGKLATCLVIAMIASHLIWHSMAAVVSNVIILVCTGFVLFSFVLYTVEAIRLLKQGK